MLAVTVPKLRRALRSRGPTLAEETILWDSGAELVVGIDEVGRGAWAGPLTIGAVVIPKDRRIYKLRDSKQLTEAEREAMFDRIVNWALASAVGHASYEECDQLGMSAAQKLAARRAINSLEVDGKQIEPDGVVLDGRWDFVGHPNTRMLVKGDMKCVSIAAASILAKVTRDRIMRAEAKNYPGFNFEANKGYPCGKHRMALQGYGPTAIHRRSWSYMDKLVFNGVERVMPFAERVAERELAERLAKGKIVGQEKLF
jgi:ribonuclease HII